MERQFENRNLKLENCDIPPKKSLFPENRISLPQCPQCHPRVSKHHQTDLKPLSPQYSSRSSPRRPYPQCPQWHPRMPKRSSIDPSARGPCLQGAQCHPRVSNRSSIGPSAQEPCLQGVQCHPRVSKHHRPTSNLSHPSIPPGPRHGDLAHKCFRGILSWPL